VISVSNELLFLAPRGYGGESEFEKVFGRIKESLRTTFESVRHPLNVHFFIGCDAFELSYPDPSQQLNRIYCSRYRTHNFFIYIYKLIRSVGSLESPPSLLVAGDARLGFVAARILRFKFKSAKIQLQLHGNAIHVMGNQKWPSWLRRFYVKLLINNSDSIRMVSLHQKVSYEKLIGRPIPNVVIAPVPFQISSNPRRSPIESVGFVGRIHPERGIKRWVDVASEVSRANPKIKFVIIGDGPCRQEFLKKLSLLPNGGITYLGWLSKDELQANWPQIGLLLSTAESESYGVTLREALCSGLQVVAFENHASIELNASFSSYVHIANTTSGLAKAVLGYIGSSIPQDELVRIHDRFLSLNLKSTTKIGQTWADLINSH